MVYADEDDEVPLVLELELLSAWFSYHFTRNIDGGAQS